MQFHVSYYIRQSELPYSGCNFTKEANHQELTAKKVVTDFNFVDPALFKGLKIADFRLVRRGSSVFFSLTLSDQVKKSVTGSAPYRNLFRSLASRSNLWQTIVYHNTDGSVGVCSRERMNAIRKDGTRRLARPVKLS